MRNLILAAALFLSGQAHGQAIDTLTPNVGFTLIGIGSLDWGGKTNDNWSLADGTFATLAASTDTTAAQFDQVAADTTTLRTDLDAETAARIAADLQIAIDTTTIQANLDAEEALRQARDDLIGAATDQLRIDLTQESSDRLTGDALLGGATGLLRIDLNQEITDRTDADDAIGASTAALLGFLNAETDARVLADDLLGAATGLLRTDLTAESAARLAGDDLLGDATAQLRVDFTAGDAAEALARIAQDSLLGAATAQNRVDFEAQDSVIGAATGQLQVDLDAETLARIAQDALLGAATAQNRVDFEAADTAEAGARLAGDALLGAATGQLQVDLDAETAARIAQDDLIGAATAQIVLAGDADHTLIGAATAQIRVDFEAVDTQVAIDTTSLRTDLDAFTLSEELIGAATAQNRVDFEAGDALLGAATAQIRTDFEAADTQVALDTTSLRTDLDAETVARIAGDGLLGAATAQIELDFEAADVLLGAATAQVRVDFLAADSLIGAATAQNRVDFLAADTLIGAATSQIRTDFEAADTQVALDTTTLDSLKYDKVGGVISGVAEIRADLAEETDFALRVSSADATNLWEVDGLGDVDQKGSLVAVGTVTAGGLSISRGEAIFELRDMDTNNPFIFFTGGSNQSLGFRGNGSETLVFEDLPTVDFRDGIMLRWESPGGILIGANDFEGSGDPRRFVLGNSVSGEGMVIKAQPGFGVSLAVKDSSIRSTQTATGFVVGTALTVQADDGVAPSGSVVQVSTSSGGSMFKVRGDGLVDISSSLVVGKDINVTDNVVANKFIGPLEGTADLSDALSGTPTLCSVGDAARGIVANGNATGCFTTPTLTAENVWVATQTINAPLVFGSDTTGTGSNNAVFMEWITSVDGAAQSEGCAGVIRMTGTTRTDTQVWTSTPTAMVNESIGVLAQACTPPGPCLMATGGLTFVDCGTVTKGDSIVTSGVRCRVGAEGTITRASNGRAATGDVSNKCWIKLGTH